MMHTVSTNTGDYEVDTVFSPKREIVTGRIGGSAKPRSCQIWRAIDLSLTSHIPRWCCTIRSTTPQSHCHWKCPCTPPCFILPSTRACCPNFLAGISLCALPEQVPPLTLPRGERGSHTPVTTDHATPAEPPRVTRRCSLLPLAFLPI